MGKRGPAPGSPEVAKLRGTYRPVRHDRHIAPAIRAPIGAPPAWFPPAQAAMWREIVQHAPVHLCASDEQVIGALAWACVTFQRLAIRQMELTVDDPALDQRLLRFSNAIVGMHRALALAPIERMRLAGEGRQVGPEAADEGWDVLRRLRVVAGGKG